jgi:hypothetical protein
LKGNKFRSGNCEGLRSPAGDWCPARWLHGDHVIVDADKKAGKMKFKVSKRVGEKEAAGAKK